MVERVARWCLRYRRVLVVAVLVLTALASYHVAKNINSSDNSLPVWFDSDDPDYVAYNNYVDTFGHDRFVILGLEFDEVFTYENLVFIHALTEAIKKIPDVERISSITHVQYVEALGDEIRIGPFIAQVPSDAGSLALLKRKALSEENYLGNVISADTKVTAILAKVSTGHSIAESTRLKDEIFAIVDRLNTKHHLCHISGSPITDEAFDRLVVKDQKMFTIVSTVLMILLIFIFFRNASVSLVPTLLQLVVLLWMLALYYLLGYKMNVVGGMMVPILFAVCIADSVHMMLEYHQQCSNGLDRQQALINASRSLWRPCLYTALTTLAGFISFQSSTITPINVMGTITAIGVMVTFVMTIFFIPVVITFLPEPKKKLKERCDNHLVQKFLLITSRWNERYPGLIVSLFVVFTVASIFGMTRLNIETNFLEYFPAKDPVRRDVVFFNKRLSGVVDYEIILSPRDSEREIANDPQVLVAIENFRAEAKKDPLTTQSYSHTDTLKKLNQVLHAGDPTANKIPATQEAISQLGLLATFSGDQESDQYKTSDGRQIHLSFRTNLTQSELMNGYLAKIANIADNHFVPLGITASITGFSPLWAKLDHDILISQIASFAIAFVVVSLMMMTFLKSFKVGLISMVPNVLPILFTMGLMGFMGIDLNVSTVMIAGVTIGITVDDTIHYLTRFREFLKQEGDYARALRLTNNKIGTAIIFTSCILIGGFGVMILGSFIPSIYFGAMVAVTLFMAIFCEIFLTPILLLWCRPFKI